jgi:GNAT superfamily N-acetyltransferase
MLFADIALARRIEGAECRLSCDIADVFRAKGRDAFAHPVAGGAAVFTGPDTPFNKLIGLGFSDPIEEDGLAAAEQAFADRRSILRAEVSSLADPSIVSTLSGRGYKLIGFEDVLGMRLVDLTALEVPQIRVALVDARVSRSWIDTVVTGFMTPDTDGVPSSESFPREALEPLLDDMLAVPGYHHFTAWIDGTEVGGASMRLDGGLAQLSGASTLPAYRRRGVQTALLGERLRWAASQGCDLAVVTTQPGSKSQQNAVRRGFDRLYTRAVLVKSP